MVYYQLGATKMKNLLLLFLSIIIVACDERNVGCDIEKMQNNSESYTICTDESKELHMAYQITTKINQDSDVGEYLEVITGDHTVLEYVNHSHATNATDITGSIELVLIVNGNHKFSDGEIIKIPTENIKGIGAQSGAWIGYNQFDDIEGKIKIIEARKNTLQIEIIDSLFSVNGIIAEEWDGKYQKGVIHPYSITGKIRFNK